MSTELEALKQKRLKWVESNRENGFDEGINRLLTELYPDNAHFIYELLQNAEDPEATEVKFDLTDSAVEFVHNGKRLFELKDVESITSIGNSTKRDDETSIGKFGVGFKAVFAYTNTPEIHSGDFHFRIRDLVVPETEGVEQSQTSQTRFKFPFDNPKKPAKTALQEIEKGLRALGDNTLLFLNHIRKIEYMLPDGSKGSQQRIDQKDGRIEIRALHPDGNETISHWLHFQKTVEIADDNSNPKTCSIAIAYSLVEESNKKTEKISWKIVPLQHGQVSIYFPAEKETSNLRFHLHAPFASTVARDSVRDCQANHQLRDGLAELIVESLSAIRDQDLLTVSFLAVLPNPSDNLSDFYEPIRTAIVDVFDEEVLTPMKQGGHDSSYEIFKGPTTISDVISDEDLVFLLDNDYERPMWVANPPQKNQREDKFLESLGIKEWGWHELVNTINSLYKCDLERINTWIKKKDDKWLISFYALLGEACSNNKQTISVGNTKIIRVSTEQGDDHVIPSLAFFPPAEGISAPVDALIVKNWVYAIGRSDEQKRLAKLFLEKSGVLPFDSKQVIKLKLGEYEKRPEPTPDAYWIDIKLFFEYWFKDPISNIALFKNKTFLLAKSRDGKINWHKPNDIYIDKPFSDTGLKDLFNQNTFKLEKYKSELLETYRFVIPNFTDFAIALGVMDRIEIKSHDATAMQSDFVRQSGRKTKNTQDKDFYINALNPNNGQWWHSKGSPEYLGELPLYKNNLPLSRVVWNTVCRAKSEQLTAHYVPNQAKSHLQTKTEAFFIKQLTNCAWLPNREGNFLKPADLTLETLHQDLHFHNTNGWLTAVKFGENTRKLSEEYQAKNNKAQDFGFESAERASKWAELDKLGISPDELLAKQKHIEQPEKSVPNPERRRKGILERSENAPSKESVTRERSIQPGIANVQAEAKAYLRAIYTNKNREMACQCCQNEMPFKTGNDYYFEAVQCFKNVKSHYIENRLALCPVCSAMYQYARQTDDNAIQNLIIMNDAGDDSASVGISITLALEKYNLRFVGSHWFDLKTILENI
ncbi:MAG: hypothetical protein Q8Q40_15380 [Methylococcaceae bacterium]|nr:hypothetical protein [Methylococcaceae bacterium]MDP3905338.1 hypothetical protein [Methylococcaceae bacterium]